jgi:hypothetical protein
VEKNRGKKPETLADEGGEYTPQVNDRVTYTDITVPINVGGVLTHVYSDKSGNIDLDGGGTETHVTYKEGNLNPSRYYEIENIEL